MAKLILKFENTILREVSAGAGEVSIGRSPENAVMIDNPAVSHFHARVFGEDGRLMIEDFGSLNGTLVNGQRIQMASLKTGDVVTVGKHTLTVLDASVPAASEATASTPRPAAPKINETMMLGTRQRRELLQQVAASGERSQVAPQRLRIPTLVVRDGRTDQREYLLTDKLTVIGKSAMATVKLKGWFVPKAAAQISRREDNQYYIGAADNVPRINGSEISHPTKLSEGDVIEVSGVKLEFIYRD